MNELFTASVITALPPLLVAALLLRVICGFRAFLGLLDKLYVESKSLLKLLLSKDNTLDQVASAFCKEKHRRVGQGESRVVVPVALEPKHRG